MKKFIFLFACAGLFAACHRKAAPDGNAAANAAKETAKTESKNNTAPVSNTPSMDNKNQTSDIRPPMSLDLGKSVFVNKCAKCHELKQPNAFTKNQWEGIMKSMGPKAKLTADETDQVNAYLFANAK